jgi:hypothetical protein
MSSSPRAASGLAPRWLAAVVIAAAIATGCAAAEPAIPPDTSLHGLQVNDVQPRIALPGARLVVTGSAFTGPPWGEPSVRLRGSFAGEPIDVAVPARFVDEARLEVDVDDGLAAALGGEGELHGELMVEVLSAVDGATGAGQPPRRRRAQPGRSAPPG